MTKKGNNKPLWGFVAVSVVVHGAIIGLLSKSIHISQPKDKNQPDNTPLQAKLVFIPTPIEHPAEEQGEEVVELESGPSKEQTSDLETVQLEPEAAENDPVVEEPLTQEALSAPMEVEPEPVTHSQVETITDPINTTATESQILTGSGTERNYPVDSRDIARQHLGNYQQHLQEQLAADSARAFRQQQTSPTIVGPSPEPFMTEDEKFFESAKVRVDCSSSLNKSLAFLSGLTGGTLDCSKGPDLSPFIQNRINKLPEGFQKHEQDVNSENNSADQR